MNKTTQAASRAGKKFIGGYFDHDVAKLVKSRAVAEDTTIQELMGEAIELLFQKRNMHIQVRS